MPAVTSLSTVGPTKLPCSKPGTVAPLPSNKQSTPPAQLTVTLETNYCSLLNTPPAMRLPTVSDAWMKNRRVDVSHSLHISSDIRQQAVDTHFISFFPS